MVEVECNLVNIKTKLYSNHSISMDKNNLADGRSLALFLRSPRSEENPS